MATLKNTTINDTGFLRLPKGTTGQRPANAAGRIRHNTDTGTVEYYSENALAGGWTQMTIPFQNRTIITNAYMQGGYKSSAAWNNINRTLTATDTTYNLGDGAIERSFNYQPGACSLDDAYIFGAGGGHAVSSNYVTAFNMRTEQQTTDIDRSLAINRHNFGAVFQEHYLAWCSGGSSTLMEEYNLTTKTYNGQIGATSLSGANWGMSSENIGIQYNGSSSNTFTFSTRTIASRGGTQPGNSHQQKAVQSKIGSAWAGAQGSYNGGYTFRKTSFTTNSTASGPSKPVGNCGEENLTMGQDHQYMIGQYNGLQNNISWKFNYASEQGFQGGASMEPKGKAGASSGTCAWRS